MQSAFELASSEDGLVLTKLFLLIYFTHKRWRTNTWLLERLNFCLSLAYHTLILDEQFEAPYLLGSLSTILSWNISGSFTWSVVLLNFISNLPKQETNFLWNMCKYKCYNFCEERLICHVLLSQKSFLLLVIKYDSSGSKFKAPESQRLWQIFLGCIVIVISFKGQNLVVWAPSADV